MGAHFSKTTDELLARFFALPKEERIGRALKWAGVPTDLADEAYYFSFFPKLQSHCFIGIVTRNFII